jgi:ribosomal protein L16 Arg81 hydroxylase
MKKQIPDNRLTFEKLIHPITRKEFVEKYWERQSLHVQRNDEAYYNLVSLDDIDKLIHSGRPATGEYDVLASRMPPEAKQEEKIYLDSRDRDFETKLHSFYANGFTLNVSKLERRNERIAEILKEVEKFSGTYCYSVMFVSPLNGQQGFPIHYDAQELFILQIVGSKRWTLYEPQYEKPHTALFAPRIDETELEQIDEVEMRSGDLLYLPRGIPHKVVSLEQQPCAHLVIGVEPCRWMDVLLEAVQVYAQESLELRKTVALLGSLASGDRESLRQDFRKLLSDVAIGADFERTIARVENNIIGKTLPIGDGYFGRVNRSIGLWDRLKVRENVLFSFSRFSNPDGSLKPTLTFTGKVVTVPEDYFEAMVFILSAKDFCASDLPGNLSDNERVELLRGLLAKNLLTFV